MYMTKLRTVGGSVMFAIPKSILEGLDLVPNANVGMTITEGRLIIEPHPKPRYSMKELLAQCDLSAPNDEETNTWMSDSPVGRERI